MAKVPVTGEFTYEEVKDAIVSTGGTFATGEITLEDLIAQSDWERFDPLYLNGATSKLQITEAYQFRGYPRDKFGNVVKAGSFQKQCSGDGVGSWHTYTVPASTYYSFVDQAAADAQAQADVEANGQGYANSVSGGFCTWYSDEFTDTFFKEGCGYRGVGSSITHTIAAATKSSTTSKSNANDQAIAEMNAVGQAAVNSSGYCTWYSEYRADYFQRNNCGGGMEGSTVWVEALENDFSSTASLDGANSTRNAWMQAEANANGTCSSGEIPYPSLSLISWEIGIPGFSGYVAKIKVSGKPSDPTIEIAASYSVSSGGSVVHSTMSGPDVDGAYILERGFSVHSTGTLNVIFFRSGEPGAKTSTIFLDTMDA